MGLNKRGRRGGGRGRSGLSLGQRAAGMPQLSSQLNRQRAVRARLGMYALAGLTLLLIALASGPLWLPLLRAVVPDRYLMAYLPGFVQDMVFDVDVSEQVPTPVGASSVDAQSLLGPTLTPAPPTLTPAPAVVLAGGTPGGYVQPTFAPLEPTVTVTPAFSIAVDAAAVDAENSADLTNVQVLLTGFDWEQQGLNNCGPASLSVYMSYWGVKFTEDEAAAYLKPNADDTNVRPDELAAFAEQKGYQGLVRSNGSIELLKNFLLAGYPVMIETGYDPEPTKIGWTSHYLTLVGYTDEGFIAMDTYRRPNWFYDFQEIDTYWRQFNRRYIILHRPDQAVAVASIVGEDMDDQTMWLGAQRIAQAELSLNREDPFGWYNLGAALTHLGEYDKAVSAFDEARRLGLPWRFLWYQFEPYEAYMAIGAYEEVIALADSVLEKRIINEEAYYYKGLALIALGQAEDGRTQIELAVRFNRNYQAAQDTLDALDAGG